MPFANEHACRVEDPDEYDEFTRDDDAAEVAGRPVDHIFGIRDPGVADLQAVRYPLSEGWDTQAAMLDAQEHCSDVGGIEFEPAEGFASACATCGDKEIHDMTHETKFSTVEADSVVRRDIKGDEREVLRVPISSTHVDREGDHFTKEALEGMADQIRSEQPLVFQNHGLAGSWMDAIPYDQAETIGTHFDAEIEAESKGGDETEHTLFSFINPDHTHPEGTRMLKQVRDEKQAIKFSVGFRIHDHDPVEDEAGNEIGRAFTNVDLMEDSKVGIPANPNASVPVEASAKGAAPAMQHPLMQLFTQQMGVRQTEQGATSIEAKGADGQSPHTHQSDPPSVDKQPSETESEDGEDALLGAVEGLAEAVAALSEEVADIRDDVDDLREADEGEGNESEPEQREGDPDPEKVEQMQQAAHEGNLDEPETEKTSTDPESLEDHVVEPDESDEEEQTDEQRDRPMTAAEFARQ